VRLGMIVDYSGGFEETADLLVDYERAGLELAAVAEAYSFDAVSQLGYLAAKTKTLELASAILQVYSRTPALLAMTAAGLDYVSGGRFTLGLGASGPQVVEGFHGVPYDAPLGRTREVIEICRQVWRREPLVHDGKHYTVPLPPDRGTGLGKPLKLINHPVRDRIPISVAALGPANVALVAEIAESWQPLFFHPGQYRAAWGEALEKGLAKRDPELGPLDIMLQVSFAVGEPDPAHLATVRNQLALYIGGMGAKGKNFYNQLAQRYGYAAEAAEIQDLYLAGRKEDAARVVPDDLVRAVSLLGPEDEIALQLKEFASAGVTTLLLNPLASSPEQRVADVATLSRLSRSS
jgi:F420-dependent oxidoreductase-like protein